MTQGDTCKRSTETESFPSTGTAEISMGPEPPSQAVSEELPLARHGSAARVALEDRGRESKTL